MEFKESDMINLQKIEDFLNGSFSKAVIFGVPACELINSLNKFNKAMKQAEKITPEQFEELAKLAREG